MDTLVAVYLIFGGGLAFLLALTAPARPTKACLAAAGGWQCLGGLHQLDPQLFPGINLLVPAVAGFCLWVPLVYTMAPVGPKPARYPYLHFLPALAALACLPLLYDSPVDVRSAMALVTPGGPWAVRLLGIVLYAAVALAALYGWRLTRAHVNHRSGPVRHLVWMPPVLALVWITDRLLDLGLAPLFYGAATTALIVLHVKQQKIEPPREAYAVSHLGGLAPEALTRTLDRLMTQERLHTREDLTRRELAQAMGISEHQLSEFLSRHLETRFYTLINHYRIQEAQELLVRHPDQKILAVALEAGFRSPSAFYNAFKKETGLSPGQYRAQAGKESPS